MFYILTVFYDYFYDKDALSNQIIFLCLDSDVTQKFWINVIEGH